MNHRLQLLVATVAMLAVTLACRLPTGDFQARTLRGSGTVIEEVREIGAIDAVELSTLGTLEIELGDSTELRIEAEDNILPHIRTQVRGRTLIIDNERGRNLRPTREVRYYLRVESLERIELSSSGDAFAPALSADTFTIRVSSSGDLELEALSCDTCDIRLSSSGGVRIRELEATTLEVEISSSGSLTLDNGEVTRQNLTLSSSGNYNAANLRSERAEVQLSSSGTARIWVEDELRGRLSSSGDVRYNGDPNVDIATTASGRARRE